jgi:hypothetical protein
MDDNEVITPEMLRFADEFSRDFWNNVELLMKDGPSNELEVYLRGWCVVLATLALDDFNSMVVLLKSNCLRAAFMLGRPIIDYHVRLRYYILQAQPSIAKFGAGKSSLKNLKKKMHAARDWENSEKKLQVELNTYKYDVLPDDVKAQIQAELEKSSETHSQNFRYMIGIVYPDKKSVDFRHTYSSWLMQSMFLHGDQAVISDVIRENDANVKEVFVQSPAVIPRTVLGEAALHMLHILDSFAMVRGWSYGLVHNRVWAIKLFSTKQ